MTEELRPVEPQLFQLAAAAVEEGLERVRQLKAENRYIGTYFGWHRLSQYDSGLPSLTESFMSGPTDHKDAFTGVAGPPLVDPDGLETFKALLSYATSHSRLRSYFSPPSRDFDEKLFKVEMYLLAEYLIDRYIHVCKDAPFSIERLLPIYLPLEAGIFADSLTVDVVVPILFLKFDFDSVPLGANAHVERMDDEFQLARAAKRAYEPGVHPSVLSAASHALILSGWELKNENYWEVSNTYSEVAAYPLHNIDMFFAALRTVAGADSGYAQLLLRPLNWAHDYTAHLPPVEGTSIRRYRGWFENFHWLRSVATMPEEEVTEAGRLYSKLIRAESNRLTIASQRLNYCFLRESEEDSVLDATIAMEVLLSDDSRQEMTHKLALRVAALSRFSGSEQTPVEVYRAVKRIYAYRPAIVHGSTKTERNREIALSGQDKIPTVTAAINYLRMIVSVLTEHDEYLDPNVIDEELLLG